MTSAQSNRLWYIRATVSTDSVLSTCLNVSLKMNHSGCAQSLTQQVYSVSKRFERPANNVVFHMLKNLHFAEADSMPRRFAFGKF